MGVKTFRGAFYRGRSYGTDSDAAKACLTFIATLNGTLPRDEAIKHIEGGRELCLEEFRVCGWDAHELIVEDWDSISRGVIEDLLSSDEG